jgi:hypothetical protein
LKKDCHTQNNKLASKRTHTICVKVSMEMGKKEDTYPLTVVCTAWQAAAQLVRNLMHGVLPLARFM